MQVISGLKAAPLIFWTVLMALLGVVVLHGDLNGDGLTVTQLYLVLGVFIYPVFYGCVLFALAWLASALWYRNEYLRVDAASIVIGRKVVPLTDVQDVVVQRNPLGISQLIIRRNQGANIGIAGYVLSRPAAEIARRLSESLPANAKA